MKACHGGEVTPAVWRRSLPEEKVQVAGEVAGHRVSESRQRSKRSPSDCLLFFIPSRSPAHRIVPPTFTLVSLHG